MPEDIAEIASTAAISGCAKKRVMVLPRAKIGGRRKPKQQAETKKRNFTPDRRRFFASVKRDDPLNLRRLGIRPMSKPDWTHSAVPETSSRPRVALERKSTSTQASWKAIQRLNKQVAADRLRNRVVLTGWDLHDRDIRARERDELRQATERSKWHRLYTGSKHTQSAPALVPATAPARAIDPKSLLRSLKRTMRELPLDRASFESDDEPPPYRQRQGHHRLTKELRGLMERADRLAACSELMDRAAIPSRRGLQSAG